MLTKLCTSKLDATKDHAIAAWLRQHDWDFTYNVEGVTTTYYNTKHQVIAKYVHIKPPILFTCTDDLFPIYRRHRDVKCFKCNGRLRDHTPTGYPKWYGALKGFCALCGMWTFFDVIGR